MDELAAHLTEFARREVRAALAAESADAALAARKEEAARALRSLLRSSGQVRMIGAHGRRVIETLRRGLEHPVPADDAVVQEYAAEVGKVMASAWLQFLALALQDNDPLVLGANLLPTRDQARQEFWRTFRGAVISLPIGVDGIMKRFADQFVAGTSDLELPMGLVLTGRRRSRALYVARHR